MFELILPVMLFYGCRDVPSAEHTHREIDHRQVGRCEPFGHNGIGEGPVSFSEMV